MAVAKRKSNTMQRIDWDCSIVDWLIEHPAQLALLEELGIDYSCGGRSLGTACDDAAVERSHFAQRATTQALAADAEAEVVRPLDYWLKRHPPGFLSKYTAAQADPLALAAEVHTLGLDFLAWVRLSRAQRWNTYALQVLSGHLFSTFRKREPHERTSEVTLLELAWPPGSEAVRATLSQLQDLLAAPFAVFRAVRAPLEPHHYPSDAELDQAIAALTSSADEFSRLLQALHAAINKARESTAL